MIAIIPMAILVIVILGILGCIVYRIVVKSKLISKLLADVETPSVAVEHAKSAIDTVDESTRGAAERIKILEDEVAKGDEFLGKKNEPDVEPDESK